MTKSANLYARIEPEVKERAEEILDILGISASTAINMFYKQIILENGIPFDVKLPESSLDISKITQEEFDAKLEKGYKDYLSGNVMSAEDAFADIRKESDAE